MTVFLDTSVLLAGLVDFGPQSAPAQSLLHSCRGAAPREAGDRLALLPRVLFSRDPPPSGISRWRRPMPALLEEEVFAPDDRARSAARASNLPIFRAAARDAIVGGRVYDAHIAEVARAAGATVVVTDNRRHFLLPALRYGLRVETPGRVPRDGRGRSHADRPRVNLLRRSPRRTSLCSIPGCRTSATPGACCGAARSLR